jgi:pilus assembly protein Flp/PilA
LQHGAGRIPSASPGVSFMRRLLKIFFMDDSGATAIEYALIAMGISIVIVASVNGIGTALNSKFTTISTSLK